MRSITQDKAYEMARIEVERLATEAGDHFALIPEETRTVDIGWVFFFNSSDFVRSRDPKDALAGNGPILVSHGGQLRHLPSHMSWQDALQQA